MRSAPRGTKPDEDAMDATRYYPSGHCFFCHERLEARPNGVGCRHVDSKAPYGACVQALAVEPPF